MQVINLINIIESFADPALSANWDNSGVQVASDKSEIQKLAVTLDPTENNISEALQWKADFILTHHPLSISPKFPNKNDKYNKILRQLFQQDAWLYSAHTSLDVQTTGPVAWLAWELQIENLQAVDPVSPSPETQIRVQVDKGADQLAKKIRETHPEVEIDFSEQGSVTLICGPQNQSQLLNILTAHPFSAQIETAEVFKPRKPCGYGIIGEFPRGISGSKLSKTLSRILDMDQWTRVGIWPQTVQRLSYCPGSGMDLAPRAFAMGADVFISGDLKYHQAQELEGMGMTLDVGHFILEEKMMRYWTKDLEYELNSPENIRVKFFPGRNPMQTKN